ncbi:MAG: S9 family peptidase [Flavobacteriia bacterium]|nr:S9 family peptidase [Flavobacteriia bacterium]
MKRINSFSLSPDKKFVLYEVSEYSLEKNSGKTGLFVLDISTLNSQKISSSNFSEYAGQWGKNNEIYYLSSESGNTQIWKTDLLGKNKIQISNVQEFEVEGFTLSKQNNQILLLGALKMKQSLHDKHPDLPLTNARLEDDLMYRHWNSWQDQNKRHLLLFELKENKLSSTYTDLLENQFLDGILPPFGGIEDACFSSDDSKIFYSCKKKKGKDFALSTNSDVYSYDIKTLKTSNLSSDNKGYDLHPKISPKGTFLSWLSMKSDGFEADKNDIILYDLKTNQKNNLTQNIDLTIDEYCYSEDEKKIYFIAPFKGCKQIFELNIATKEWKQISKYEQDFLSISVYEDKLLTLRQSFIQPTDIVDISLKSLRERNLSSINRDLLDNIELPSFQERWVETSDGKKMHVWMIFPPNFNQNKKYPSILFCNGGPQSMVSQFFSYRWNLAYFASQGYIVIAPNRRGLPGFGQEWNDAISKDWGGQAIKDYISTIDVISNEPFIDVNRIGAVGASYGGYSVYYLAGMHNKRFKTFISHCGLFNLESWYGTTDELFFANWDNKGPYWMAENKEYYLKHSPHNMLNNWDTPMLVIHGGKDFRVPETEGMQAYQALQVKGLRSKFLYFPEEGHWIMKPQNSVLWYREFIEWLDTDLKK